MRLVIVNGDVITGDGETVLEKSSVVISDGIIVEIVKGSYFYDYKADKVVDAGRGYIIPGIINNHAHGVTFGPLFPSGEKPLARSRVMDNLNRHMLQGTTTILNNDGFASIEEVTAVNKIHPVNVKTGTTHTPLNVKAAQAVDGSGLKEEHKMLTVEGMLKMGAVAIAEIGAGATLGGGLMDYNYIPKAVKGKTGVHINPTQGRALKEAILGTHIDINAFDHNKASEVLKQAGLADNLTVEEAKKLVEETVLPPFNIALEGFEEAAIMCKKFNVPMIVHNAAASKHIVLKIAHGLGNRLVAGHSSHPSFEVSEAVSLAKKLKECGVIIDLLSGDYYGARQLVKSPEINFALVQEGLADIISTDFMGGFWDGILLVLKKSIEQGIVDLPKAIAMATGNVARILPELAPNRGLIALGKRADIVIAGEGDISRVNTVIINGEIVVENSQIKRSISARENEL